MRRTAQDTAETRRRILDAALPVFAEKGWAGTTFDGIARRIGLTRGAVHHHFHDKDALLRSVLRAQWADRADLVLAPLREVADTPAERLTSFVANYLRLLATDETFRALATVTVLVAPGAKGHSVPSGLADKREALDRWRDELSTVLADASALGDDVQLERAVFVIMNFVLGATVSAAALPGYLPTDPDAVAAAVVAGLTTPERPR